MADMMSNTGNNLVRTWFWILGAALLLLALLGSFGIAHPLGPQDVGGAASPAETSGPLHLEGGELAVHWLLGIAFVAIPFFVKDTKTNVYIAWAAAAVFVLVGIVGFVQAEIGPWHVGTIDNVLHLLLGGVSGVVAWMAGQRAETMTGTRVPR